LSKHRHLPASVNHLENDTSVRHQQLGENDIECETKITSVRRSEAQQQQHVLDSYDPIIEDVSS